MIETLEKLKEYIESGAYEYSSPTIGKKEVECCIKALEKQIEHEAMMSSSATLGNNVIQTYICPMCGAYTGFKTIEMNYGIYKYCECCGQKVRIGDIDVES